MPAPPQRAAPDACFHGGAFWEAIGPRFDDLARRRRVLNADVLDAWFDPAPGALAALRGDLPWLCRTSPPTRCEGLVAAIAAARGVPPSCIVPGAGSSDLIFRALREWLSPSSVVALLEPTYAEYPFVLEHVIGCRTLPVPLDPGANFAPDFDALDAAARRADLVILVNPNSPTGTLFDPDTLWRLIERHTPDYYRARWTETHTLRSQLAAALRPCFAHLWQSPANFILCETADGAETAAALIAALRAQNIFVRNVSCAGRGLIRIAVKGAEANRRIAAAVRRAVRATEVATTDRDSRPQPQIVATAQVPHPATSALPTSDAAG